MALLISYPVLVHVSVLFGINWLQCVAMLLLLAGISFPALKRRSLAAWGLLIGAAVIFAVLAWANLIIYALFVPPVLWPVLLLLIFGYTLLPGREALVTQIGEQARGPLTAPMRKYTRRVTQIWVGLFFLLALEALIMPLYASLAAWSTTTNILNYLLVGVFFVAEYYFRKRRFPEHDHPGFIENLKIVLQADIGRRHG